jgi:hypothetical protein
MPMLFKELKHINTPQFPKMPKNPLEKLAEKLETGVQKASEKIQEVVKKGQEIKEAATKTIIAVEEAGLNIAQGKSAEEVVTEFAETIKTKDIQETTKTFVNHQIRKSERPVISAEVTKQQTARPVVQKKMVETFAPISPPLLILREIISFPRGGDGSQEDDRARKYARFAAHCYGDLKSSVLPKGCVQIETETTEEGLRATLYNDNGEIICAFAGSGMNAKDWENNFTQLIGGSKQYEEALEYARGLAYRYPDKQITFVGHSQGGGEAAYCAYNLGMQAETYNPAGLSIFTIYKGEYKQGAHINAYVFSTDILNALQSAVGIEADGEVEYIHANIFQHGMHGIKGILRYFKIWFEKKKKKRKKR